MAPTYRTKDGYSVEVVQLSDTSGNQDGEWLRVRYHGYHVADVRSVAELERYFPLGELEADGLARRRAPGRRSVGCPHAGSPRAGATQISSSGCRAPCSLGRTAP
jgi:hypothetical protein